MFLENVVFDALDPNQVGRFWEAALDTETLTDEPAGFETRLHHPDGPVLDLCFQPVPDPPSEPLRLHLVLAQSAAPPALADTEGNPVLVAVEQEEYADTGPLVALRLDSADPDRDGALWEWLTGWTPVPGTAPVSLRHPSRRGPVLELHREAEPKGPGKNRRHLDVRLERGDDPDQVARGIVERGGSELVHDWGTLPWRSYVDASGNEFCVLPAPA